MSEPRALVSGGSGAVGAAIVRALVRDGMQVAFTFHQNETSARELSEETGASAHRLDVLDAAACMQLADAIGPVDVLVNNAGITEVLPFALIEEEDWDRIMDVNVKGMFLVTRAFLRGMVRTRRGSVVNMGSLAGARMLEVPVHYAASKSAIVGFTLALAREVGRYGIRVNAVVPGLLTEGVSRHVPERQAEDYAAHCALGRAGTPEEVAELVAFLAGDRSGYLNAQAIHVDGGL